MLRSSSQLKIYTWLGFSHCPSILFLLCSVDNILIQWMFNVHWSHFGLLRFIIYLFYWMYRLLTMKKKQSVVAIINWRFSFLLCTSFRSDDALDVLLANRHGKSSFCTMKKKWKKNQLFWLTFYLRDYFVLLLTEILIPITIKYIWMEIIEIIRKTKIFEEKEEFFCMFWITIQIGHRIPQVIYLGYIFKHYHFGQYYVIIFDNSCIECRNTCHKISIQWMIWCNCLRWHQHKI